MSILDKVNLPEDLKKLSLEELYKLSDELREYIIDVVSRNGGHLAPSLGVVELTVALLRALDLPNDKIIWDVGHQSYAYKILTGRKKEFKTLRKDGGISGFPRREESPYDFFGTGHSSTSISAALGIYEASKKLGSRGKIFVVIGDGSIGAGMAFEALNHAGALKRDIVVILNDNEMAISPTVGALYSFIGRKMTSRTFSAFRAFVKKVLGLIPVIGESLVNVVRRIEESVISLFTPGILFEGLGFHYVGPVDGHNIKAMVEIFSNVKEWDRPVLVHLITKKGKGYKPAENDPETFHGVSGFDKETGKVFSSGISYSQVFGEAICKFAESDEKIVVITAAMKKGTGLDKFAERFPDRFYDPGITEQHAVTFAGGMASQGLKPVVAIYSTFLQRAYDQIIHDVCLQKLPVVFAIDRAGIVGEDGPTHHGVFDIAFLRAVPNMKIMAPFTAQELVDMLYLALNDDGPVAIRYPRGSVEGEYSLEPRRLNWGEVETVYSSGKDVLILAVGRMVKDAVDSARLLSESGLGVTVVNVRFIKPLPASIVRDASDYRLIVTVEDGVKSGGFGEAVRSAFQDEGIMKHVEICALPDSFIPHGSLAHLKRMYELDGEGIANRVARVMGLWEGKR